MPEKIRRLALGLGVMAVAFGLAQYPRLAKYMAEEKRQQEEHLRTLAIQNSATWIALAKSDYDLDAKTHGMKVQYSPASVTLSGTMVTLGGFMMPLVVDDKQHQFVLSRRAPSCPFCPPGGMNELVEVIPRRAIPLNDDLSFFTGQLQLIGNNGNNIFFRLAHAEPSENEGGLTSLVQLK